MIPILTDVLPPFIISIVAAIAASYIALPLCKPFGLIDRPRTAQHKLHSMPTPMAGGLVIVLTILLLILIFPGLAGREFAGLLIGGAIIFGFGLWDDISGLGAVPKFFGQFLAGSIVLLSGISIQIVPPALFGDNQLVTSIVNSALTLLWLVGITNAFNLIDSMDGIVAGLSTTAGACFVFVTYISKQPQLMVWAAVLTGISLVIYFWNKHPSKYFLGDSGAQTLGFVLAVLAILYIPETRVQASSWFVPILMLGVPVFDTSLVVLSRLRRRSPLFTGNRDHTYHRLVHAGLRSGTAVIFMNLAAVGFDFIAVFALRQPPLTANLIFGLWLVSGIMMLLVFEFSRPLAFHE